MPANHHLLPNQPPPHLLRGARGEGILTRDIVSIRVNLTKKMEEQRLSTRMQAWLAHHPHVYYEVAMLAATVRPPATPVYLAEPLADDRPMDLFFIRRAAMPIAYACKRKYNLSPEAMIGYAMSNLRNEMDRLLRRIHLGLADVVEFAYEEFVEARPCTSEDPLSLTIPKTRARAKLRPSLVPPPPPMPAYFGRGPDGKPVKKAKKSVKKAKRKVRSS